jgi:osmoprotectant transport system permease protein
VLFAAHAEAKERVTIGSKAFPESWILGEALASIARLSGGAAVEHLKNLGGTEIVYGALRAGSIDAYPEYTGTVREVILRSGDTIDLATMRARLASSGVGVSDPLGFEDNYGLAVAAATADARGLHTISDLSRAPDLRAAFTHEFLGRSDGWPGLRARYGLALADVRGVQHELAFEALATGRVDLVDVYTTDAQIARLDLRVLADDRAFFPRYDAVVIYRLDLEQRAPRSLAALRSLAGTIDAQKMARANAALVLDHGTAEDAAAALLHDALGARASSIAAPEARSPAREIARNTARHLELVVLSLLATIVVGVPLGVAAARSRRFGALAIGATGVVQTIPSLALLALLIPLFGIGAVPAILALFLYGLLPIVRATATGLATIPRALRESAEALGLSPFAKLVRVELPMASPLILAGIKTSAVINVGTAAIAALIGAEGLGNPILQGIALRDSSLILQGAVPAALLALAVQALFGVLDRVIVPRGLRLSSSE